MNNVAFVGRWAREIELQYTKNGTAVAKSILAISKPVKVDGQPDADFAPIVMFGKLAENVAEYTKKGNLVAVTARFQSRSYENQEGKTVYVNEFVATGVQFLESKNKNTSNSNSNSNSNNKKTKNHNPFDPFAPYDPSPIDIDYDDLPF